MTQGHKFQYVAGKIVKWMNSERHSKNNPNVIVEIIQPITEKITTDHAQTSPLDKHKEDKIRLILSSQTISCQLSDTRLISEPQKWDQKWYLNKEWIALAETLNSLYESEDDRIPMTNINNSHNTVALDDPSLLINLMHKNSTDYNDNNTILSWIPHKGLAERLIEIKQQLKNKQQIDFYTDGSLKPFTVNNPEARDNSDRSHIAMGAGIYIPEIG